MKILKEKVGIFFSTGVIKKEIVCSEDESLRVKVLSY